MSKYIKYDSNNSGGSWWLTTEDWKKLEAAGWHVAWRDKEFLGAMATSAKKFGLPLEDAIAEWEKITAQDAEEMGCSCCGQPHDFSEEEEQ